MRCLWCARRVYRFADDTELMQHLQTCHGRFKYEFEKKKPTGSKSHTETIVYVRISMSPKHQMHSVENVVEFTCEDGAHFDKCDTSP